MTKRKDVGYKRPPAEHRFKKGQKRPPRKQKGAAQLSVKDVFWEVLQERRRVVKEGKPAWPSNADLIVRRAFLEAEKGSPVLQRLLNRLMLEADVSKEDELPEYICDPEPPEDGIVVGIGTIRVLPPG